MTRTHRTEFPEFADMPTIPESWTDTSWRNDTCPRFQTGNGLLVLTDHADPEQRELGGPRYSVHFDSDDLETLHEGDDWAAVLAFVESRATTLPADLTGSIQTISEAKAWIERLHGHGLAFHFEDSPDQIVKGVGGESIFDAIGACIVRQRVAELYALDWPEPYGCPIGYLLTLDGVAA